MGVIMPEVKQLQYREYNATVLGGLYSNTMTMSIRANLIIGRLIRP